MRAQPDSAPDTTTVKMLVELACRAPSVHNSQPWRWVYANGYLDLFADRSRLLRSIDPTERQLVISCGAALDHISTAATAFRWSVNTELLPTPAAPDHLARVRFTRDAHPQSHQFDLLGSISRRQSDRRSFGPVPDAAALAEYARTVFDSYGTRLTVLSAADRDTLAEATKSSAGVRRYDATYQAELRWWTGHDLESEGIPSRALPRRSEAGRVGVNRQFPAPRGVDTTAAEATTRDESTVLLLSTPSDDRRDWLSGGEALSAILLAATADGVASCPLTHLTEQARSRALVASLAPDSGVPQVLIRVGAPPPGALPRRTPRRVVSAVLAFDGDRSTRMRRTHDLSS